LQGNISSIETILHQLLDSDSDTFTDEERPGLPSLSLESPGLSTPSSQLLITNPDNGNVADDLEDFASSPESECETPANLEAITFGTNSTYNGSESSDDGLFVANSQTPSLLM